ncbi:unnamed protein product [Plutella xylostella]|uniref:(diamondback moth) hypothetical protein n=1 Tax=Plutella xylostella TaxID=51655 RepID=A0A8S4G195_PLUXY|nr:unnamed protein product [Plutella xylostella]
MIEKVITLLACLAVAAARDIKSICAGQTSNQLWPHDSDCSQFYQCSNGAPVEHSCGPGTHFNQKIQVCDFPAHVNCSKTVQDEEINYEQIAQATCAGAAAEGLQLAHRNCSQFYKCSHSKPYILDCPADLLYNTSTQTCDWPETVSCDGRIQGVSPTNNNSIQNSKPDTQGLQNINATELCASKGSEGLLLPHENCSNFYKCAGGKPVALECPVNLLYNAETKQCDWPENVNCGYRTSSLHDEPVNDEIHRKYNSSAVEACAAEDSDGKLLPHANCSKFYECAHRLPYAFDCYTGLLYNTQKEQCDWAEDVDCGDRNRSSKVSLSPSSLRVIPVTANSKDRQVDLNSEAVEACSQENSDSLLLPHENCNQFYECASGVPVEFDCFPGLMYSPERKVCDWADSVDCGTRKIPPPSSTSRAKKNNFNASAAEVCSKDESDSLLLPHENCNQFYECSQGKAISFDCPDDLLFNEEKGECDWADKVNCDDRNSPSRTQRPVVKPIVKSYPLDIHSAAQKSCCDGSADLYMAHENCKKYYMCIRRSLVSLTCPDDLLYNAEKKLCSTAREVECGNRKSPFTAMTPVVKRKSLHSDAVVACAASNSEGMLLPHESCNRFYECAQGMPAILECPDGLLYDTEAQQCEWASDVDCRDRHRHGTRKMPIHRFLVAKQQRYEIYK